MPAARQDDGGQSDYGSEIDEADLELLEITKYTPVEDEPGATVMWFGIHQGTRLDKLEERYRRTLLGFFRQTPSPNLANFKTIHDKYMAWLDEFTSPLSTTVWWGKWKGHQISVLYNSRNRWNYQIAHSRWREDCLEIEARIKAWQKRHPKQKRGIREPRGPIDLGDRLGPEDDGPASSDDGDYDSDDGFVARSDEEVEFESGEDSYVESSQEEDVPEDEGQPYSTPTHQDLEISPSDSDDSLPPLRNIGKARKDQIHPVAERRRKRRKIVESESGSETDEDAVLRAYEEERRTKTDRDLCQLTPPDTSPAVSFNVELDSDDEILVPKRKRRASPSFLPSSYLELPQNTVRDPNSPAQRKSNELFSSGRRRRQKGWA